jgi:hypothetical protein
MMSAMTRSLRRSERKLPVRDTATEAYKFVWRERGTIVRLSWFPLLVAALAAFYAEHTVAVIAAKILAIATSAVVAVALHRLILFGDHRPKAWLNLHFGKVEALFALLPFLFYATIVLLDSLGVPLEWHLKGGPALVMIGVMSIVIFFLARFCLIFPIAVVERRFDFGQAWALSHGNVWRMVGVWILVSIPLLMAFGIVQSLLLTMLKFTPAAMTAQQFDGSLLEAVVLTYPTSIVFGALCVGILSYTYKALAGFGSDAVLRPAV